MTDKVYASIRSEFRSAYDESGTIGKRYRRQDEIGTPFCITIDFDGLADGTVTVRERDRMTQERVSAEKLTAYISDKMKTWKPE
jgi:glycyl-tRNA synthetase